MIYARAARRQVISEANTKDVLYLIVQLAGDKLLKVFVGDIRFIVLLYILVKVLLCYSYAAGNIVTEELEGVLVRRPL